MVSVPERFYGEWTSEFPSLGTLQDVTLGTSLVFGQASLRNMVKYTAWETAARIEAIGIPQSLGPTASALFDNFNGYIGGIASMQSPTLPAVLIDTAESFSAIASALGAFSSVPIVGMILDFALTAVEGGLAAYSFKHKQEIESVPMGYDRARDADWAGRTLDAHAGTDLTLLFLPVTDASGGVATFNTQIDKTGIKDEIERAIYVPVGSSTVNLGGLPNTPRIPRGWEMNYAWSSYTRPHGIPWSHFNPASAQANVVSWQSVLANSRACYLVDAVQVEREWGAWQDNMQLWGWGTRYSGDDRRRIAMLSRAPVDWAQRQRIGSDGFRHLVPWMPGAGLTKNKETPYYGPLLGDVGRWAAKIQLARRQRQYLGTLTVAYCSENDPAFRSDPLLADLLRERRMLLLDHADAAHVDLAQVVDADYRSALATRQGPKGLTADPTKPSPAAGVGLSGGPGVGAPLPPILVARVGSAEPFLPTARGGGSGMANAALLALLSFLMKG